jgi:hypothetical protein
MVDQAMKFFCGLSTLFFFVACSDVPDRERFPGGQGRTTDQAAAETSKAVLGGFDPLNNRLPGMGGGGGGSGQNNDLSIPAAESIRGKITLGPKVVLREGMYLFISARTPGGGPPMAVIRDRAVEFPYGFTLSKKNAMMEGTNFSGEVELTVRLKQDPDPLSKKQGDFFITVSTKVGEQKLDLVLDQEVVPD